MITIYIGNTKTFHVESFVTTDAGATVEDPPVSGYFSLYRVNDNFAIIDADANITISGNDAYYTLDAANNTYPGLVKYVFRLYYSDGYVESFGGYAEIKGEGR